MAAAASWCDDRVGELATAELPKRLEALGSCGDGGDGAVTFGAEGYEEEVMEREKTVARGVQFVGLVEMVERARGHVNEGSRSTTALRNAIVKPRE